MSANSIYQALITPPAKRFAAHPNYGMRNDGTQKGNGWLGPIQRPDGTVMTEVSIGVGINGKEVEIPVLVPTLSQEEVSYIKNTRPDELSKVNPGVWSSIRTKAVEHAKQRLMENKSPFID